MNFILMPGQLTYADILLLLDSSTTLTLDNSCFESIQNSENTIKKIIEENKIVYGINTGFGSLANKKINAEDLELLQKSLVLSHAAGTGDFLSDEAVRLILVLKINSLARGFSGVRFETIHALISLFNAQAYPCIPCQGSVGASGDLAPLAHMSAALLGTGEVKYQNKIMPAEDVLKMIGLNPLVLGPKEGLALLNGTQVSTALALLALIKSETIFHSAIMTGALSVDAALGSMTPFDERIHLVRGHSTQIQVAQMLKYLLTNSEILDSHKNCSKVQDPYSLRCQPQVMGACLTNLNFAKEVLMIEANAVSDNPLVFSQENQVLSGGNFHAEPVAMAADMLALSIAEIGAISERRIAMLIDANFSGLPHFLVKNAGVNSGFMIAHVTATALASENKSLAHPASVDSLPSSANQEDHVSMATFAARRLFPMIENSAVILGIELLAACQGIDLRRPLKTSHILENTHAIVREKVSYYDKDRFFAPDIEKAKQIILSSQLNILLLAGNTQWKTDNGINFGSMQTSPQCQTVQ